MDCRQCGESLEVGGAHGEMDDDGSLACSVYECLECKMEYHECSIGTILNR